MWYKFKFERRQIKKMLKNISIRLDSKTIEELEQIANQKKRKI